jgi:hypothetical protein
MTRPRLRRVLKIFGIALASLVGLFAVFYGALVAYDECHDRWPQQTDLALVWTMDLLGVAEPEERYAFALELDGGSGLMRWMHWWGFDPNRPMYRHTPLTGALDLLFAPPSPDKLVVILDAGGDPNRADADGRLPLVMAAAQGRSVLLTVLLDRGAAPNSRDRAGDGVLDRLCAYGCDDKPRSIALLLDRGLDPCTTVRRRAGLPERYGVPLSDWLAAEKLPDLARRAEAACAAKRAGEGAP